MEGRLAASIWCALSGSWCAGSSIWGCSHDHHRRSDRTHPAQRGLGCSRRRTRRHCRPRNVSAWFGSNKVLERVSLVMEPRKVTALIGPSGCGKSTFLRILNRMHELVPSAALSGSVRLDGTDIYSPSVPVTQTRLRIGMVFQRPNPFPSMTIAQNVLSGLRLSGIKVPNPDALVRECLERAGLWKETRNRLNESGCRPLGRSAAAPLHRPITGRATPGAPHGRALFGARPDLDQRHRGDDQGAQSTTSPS